MRIITSSKYNAHTEPLFKIANTLRIEDIFKLQQLKFIYKLQHNILPIYFTSFTPSQHCETHNHITRHEHEYSTHRIWYDFAAKCIHFDLLYVLSNTSSNILNKLYTNSLHSFAFYTQNIFLNGYSSTCSIFLHGRIFIYDLGLYMFYICFIYTCMCAFVYMTIARNFLNIYLNAIL